MDQLQVKKPSDFQHITSTSELLQQQISAMQTVAATSINMPADNERYRKVCSFQQLFPYKLNEILKWPLSKRICVWL